MRAIESNAMRPNRYARDALNVSGILAGGGLILGLTVLGVLTAWLLLRAWGGRVQERNPPSPAFPAPMLESQPLLDYATYQRAERAKLSSLGWVDREHGIVHIPIQQAIERLSTERAHLPPARLTATGTPR